MKNFKKLVCLLLAVLMVLLCAGCMKMDMGVEIKDDGTASLTSKLFIEEEAYNSLLSFGDADAEGMTVTSEGDLDLESFKKETVDDKVYYTYEETKEFTSYEALEEALMETDDETGSSLFADANITAEDGKYTFSVTTEKMDSSETAMLGDDWLSISMSVKVPGKVTDTNGEKVDTDTVKFVIDDFSENHTYSVHSEPIKFGMRDLALIVLFFGIIGGTVAFLVYRRKKGYKF